MIHCNDRIELTVADRAAVSAVLSRAESIRAWLLGRSSSERSLELMATRSRWTAAEYAAAFELALRQEMIVWDGQSKTWSASRAWTSRGAT